MKIFLTPLLMVGLAVYALAADVGGKWKASFQTPNGATRETLFTFKVDGDKLSGTVSGQRGESQITDGKVEGDSISFAVVRNFNGNEFKMNYKGKVAGDEIQMTAGGGQRSFEMTAKRVKE
ncbi:MAG: hypothetical protein ACKV22_12780 [Bryobacteraceae bacterium]